MTFESSDNLPEEIRSVLHRLKARVRRYVILEGVAIGVIWLSLTFWLGLALDYLPVLMGAGEMPPKCEVGAVVADGRRFGVHLVPLGAAKAFCSAAGWQPGNLA